MNVIEFFINGVDARIDDALFAVSIMVILQCLMVGYSHFSKRPFTPLPALEIIIRPITAFLIDRLNRANRSDMSLVIRGLIVFVLIAVISIGFGMIVEQCLYILGYGMFMDVLLLALIISPIYPAYIGFKASKANPPKKTFYYMAQGLNQNLVATDDAGQRRNGYRLMALSMVEWVLAPIALYLIGGMGLAYGYVALSIFCRVSGHAVQASMFQSIFGLIWKSVNFVISIFGVFLVFMASIFAAGGRPLQVLKAFSYLTKGHGVEAAYAYAQRIILGGAIQDRDGTGVKQVWIGNDKSSAQLTHQDIIRGCFMHFIAVFLLWALLFTGQIYL